MKPSIKLSAPNLDNVDIRSLKVFMAVVRNRGFSAAKEELNLNQPAISSHMAQLESRLKVTLCHRGRSGFQLTEQGEQVYAAATKLFSAIECFRSDVASCRGQLAGELHIGMVDILATCEDFKLPQVIDEYETRATEIVIKLHKNAPKNLLRMLKEKQLDVVISPIYSAAENIEHFDLYDEYQVLYCGSKHPLFNTSEKELSLESLESAQYAARDYTQDWTPPPSPFLKTATLTGDIESIAILILSGNYIGYLPQHYAEHWVNKGLMKPLLITETAYSCNLQLAYLKANHNLSLQLLIELVQKYFHSAVQ